MKKFVIIAITAFCAFAAVSGAQPRALGARIGGTGFDISYQHTVGKKADFVQADLSLDFGYMASGAPGFKASAGYNFVFARPAWTQKGKWAIFAGPGLSLGYVQDRVRYFESDNFFHYVHDYGFMLSVTGQIGLEYTFWFPLQLSVDLRPYIGMHIDDGVTVRTGNTVVKTSGKVGFYDGGLLGFAPTISVRYRF